jgi:hypothetical protein
LRRSGLEEIFEEARRGDEGLLAWLVLKHQGEGQKLYRFLSDTIAETIENVGQLGGHGHHLNRIGRGRGTLLGGRGDQILAAG